MAIEAKFVVIVPENAKWIKEHATEMYSRFFNSPEETESYIENNFSMQKLIWGQNDFSIEMLMSYDNEQPAAFAQVNSSWQANRQVDGQKPICVQHIIHHNVGLAELLGKAEQVALQRKHGMVWIQLPEKDTILAGLLVSKGYEAFKPTAEDFLPKGIIGYKKVLLLL